MDGKNNTLITSFFVWMLVFTNMINFVIANILVRFSLIEATNYFAIFMVFTLGNILFIPIVFILYGEMVDLINTLRDIKPKKEKVKANA